MKSLLSRCVVGCATVLPLVWPSIGAADIVTTIQDLSVANAPISYGGDLVDNVLVLPSGGQGLRAFEAPAQNLGSFGINIVPGAGLAGNAPALAAFNRAANLWAARIADPMTITINADLAPLGAGIIGSASSTILQAGYDTVRNAMVTDAADEPSNGIMASTPTAAQFSAFLPVGRSLSGIVVLTKANAKALGFGGLDGAFGVSDGAITFSTSFAFDFDNSDGVSAGTVDFETVAAHEIGHTLGFFSIVDSIDGGLLSVSPNTLDLLRFGNNVPGQDPATSGDFTLYPRNLVPGADGITDGINDPEWRMSTGLTGGDGRQASHWKADELTGTLIGLMDPTLANGVAYGPMDPDFRALDLIGYEVIPVPEPSSISIVLLSGALLASVRRRRA